MIKLYSISTEQVKAYPNAYHETRFPARLARANQKNKENDRLLTLGAGILLYEVLGLTESDLFLGDHGKPQSEKAGPFSISHSGDTVMLAVADTAVGVDIEIVKSADLSLAHRFFAEEESLFLSENTDERFYQLWTMKEALAKAVGCGLSNRILATSVLPLLNGQPLIFDKKPYYGRSGLCGDLCHAVCAEEPIQSDVFAETETIRQNQTVHAGIFDQKTVSRSQGDR